MSYENQPLRIALVAGEASGDNLGASIIKELSEIFPHAEFEGVSGPNMEVAGCKQLYSIDQLSVMGISEVILALPRIWKLRRKLLRHFKQNPPDLFIGIDAPDFNLGLELKLRQGEIKTVHYNSPTIWAWRTYRIKKIAKAVDLMLTLFPFEEKYYADHDMLAKFVGHPLAQEIPEESDKGIARKSLNLNDNEDGPLIAILPGSRSAEVKHLAASFLETAKIVIDRIPSAHFIVPLYNQRCRKLFERIYKDSNLQLPLTMIDGQSKLAMTAADAILMACGTAVLEASLIKRPVIVAYRLSYLSSCIFKFLKKIDHYSLPNILAERPIVPEFMQDEVIPEDMATSLCEYLQDEEKRLKLLQEYRAIHRSLLPKEFMSAGKCIAQFIEPATIRREAPCNDGESG